MPKGKKARTMRGRGDFYDYSLLAVVIILCEFFGRREMNVIYSLVVAGIYLGTLLRLCVAKQKT